MRIAAFTCMGFLLAACGGSSDRARAELAAQRADLAAHRALWAERGPRSYRYTYRPIGFAPNQQIEVTVTSGAVSSATLVAGSPPAWSQGATVEGLFDDIATRLDFVDRCGATERCSAHVTYDETLGYPLSVSSGMVSSGGVPVEDGVGGWVVSGVTSID